MPYYGLCNERKTLYKLVYRRGSYPSDGRLPANQKLIIFDEIHKYAEWRNLIKGLYDKNKSSISFLVTGSARLDYYRKGGDSLLGRYHYYRLHPLSLMECSKKPDSDLVDQLLKFGGFPEPFFAGNERFWRRWRKEHIYRVFYEDLRDLEQVKEIKLYFWDWSANADIGPRFENMVAGHLLKYCHFVEDTEGYNMELRFIRDTDRREVDFVVLKEEKPLFAVECKTGERNPSAACAYFRERTDIPLFYQVHLGEKDYGSAEAGTRVLPFSTFCRELNLP